MSSAAPDPKPIPPARTIPWWKSRVMVSAYIGILIAVIDTVTAIADHGPLSWRTAVIAIGSAIAAYGRKNATQLVGDYFEVPK